MTAKIAIAEVEKVDIGTTGAQIENELNTIDKRIYQCINTVNTITKTGFKTPMYLNFYCSIGANCL